MENAGKPIVKMNNWSFVDRYYNIFFVPSGINDVRFPCLTGNVKNHPYWDDGDKLYTSPILKIDLTNKTVETENSIYELGKVDKVWKERINKEKCKVVDFKRAILKFKYPKRGI